MNSLTELKQVIDSMKSYEDGAVDTFQQQLSTIGAQHTDKAEITSVIRMMQAVGRYLGAKKEDAHKDTVPVIESLSIELEQLVLSPDLDREQTNQILSGCIQIYNALKSKTAIHPLVSSTEMQNLKSVILAVDWEISENTLKTFDTVTSQMLSRLKPHKIHHAFLKIIHSMGRYISSKKATAHKDSIVFLRDVFKNFERLVNTPDMPFQEKKQLIENDINAFHNFKRKITSVKENSPVIVDETEDEIIQPALSHVKASSKSADDDQEIVPLSPLPATSFSGQTQNSDSPAATLADKEKNAPAPRDIMDDLFNPKESPADELLDAIHLANIQGPDQKRAMNMNEPTDEELQRDGIKNFTPHRRENEPIPEIGNRLDEFFSLDTSEDSNPLTADENDPPLTVMGKEENDSPLSVTEEKDPVVPDDNDLEAIVPFQKDDELFEDDTIEYNPDKGDITQGVINRLKDLVKTHKGLLDDDALVSVSEDISHLKTQWQDDPDKTMLLDLITWLVIKNLPVSTDTQTMDDDTAPSIPEKSDKPPTGFWGKVKSIFIK